MRVARQILQNLLRTAKRRLHKDDPFDFPGLLTHEFERRRLGETGHLAMELQPAFQKCFPEINQKQPSEPAAQNLHGEKERFFLASNPANAIRADAAAGNHAMQMRMQVEILPPRL